MLTVGMAPIRHYVYECEDCGVGLTDALAFGPPSDRCCPHCYAARISGSEATIRPDPGLPN